MGATCAQSLAFAGNPSATVPYGSASIHPDGAIYLSSSNISSAQIVDGLSHTVFLCETMDDTNSRWMIGSECVLTGMSKYGWALDPSPPAIPSATTTPVVCAAGTVDFFVVPQFDGTYGDSSNVTRSGIRDFLMYDFGPQGGFDAASYSSQGDPGGSGLWVVVDPVRINFEYGIALKGPAYGPSSAHPGVVVTGFGDASVHALSKRTDAANFFFLITKNNGDPFHLPE